VRFPPTHVCWGGGCCLHAAWHAQGGLAEQCTCQPANTVQYIISTVHYVAVGPHGFGIRKIPGVCPISFEGSVGSVDSGDEEQKRCGYCITFWDSGLRGFCSVHSALKLHVFVGAAWRLRMQEQRPHLRWQSSRTISAGSAAWWERGLYRCISFYQVQLLLLIVWDAAVCLMGAKPCLVARPFEAGSSRLLQSQQFWFWWPTPSCGTRLQAALLLKGMW
jgi:hypothetical protein